MEKLVCDKCGFELTELEDINLAFEGMEAWQEAQQLRGQRTARGFSLQIFRAMPG